MTFLRPATMKDADNLFNWRNDPLTQACFKSTAAVSREDHNQWMQFSVQQGYPQHIVMIAEDENYGSIGVVRFDAQNDVLTYGVSVTMAPGLRGRGMAQDALSQACAYMHEYRLDAEIRKSNIRSRAIFRKCGFELAGESGDFVTYRREPL